jgi:TonB family protein
MRSIRELATRAAAVFALISFFSFAVAAHARGAGAATEKNASIADRAVQSDGAVASALVQVVYPLDENAEDGYRYMFFGNGFFINDQGYVVTAAHLLGYFRNGGIPYILVGPVEGPRKMIEAPIVAVDWDHDVAVLRPSPNPFESDRNIAYLRISAETLGRGNGVLSASLRPPDVQNAHSSLAPLQDFSRGQVIDYLFYRENNAQQSELMLFNQDVVPGQSGSPLLSAGTHEVVGIVVGKWLHPAVVPTDSNGGHMTMAPGAALRIHYAIGLLEQLHVSWNVSGNVSSNPSGAPFTSAPAKINATAASAPRPELAQATIPSPIAPGAQPAPAPQVAAAANAPAAPAAPQQRGYTAPTPLSVVGVPYPPQALFGGEVLLDALIDADGNLSDVRVVNGDAPFLDVALDAVRTWTFNPARVDGRAADARIGIVFQFPQSFLPNVVSKQRSYKEPLSDAGERGALPIATLEPDYPVNSIGEGSVVLYGLVDADGQLTSMSVVQDVGSLTSPTEAAVQQWKFVPGKQAGAKTQSAVIIVETFRRPSP